MSSSGNNTYGLIHRYEPPRESTAAAIAIVLLTLLEVVFIGLFTYGLLIGWSFTEFGNMFLGMMLALIFIDLAFIMLLYRKEFLPDVMIVKKRRRKWEDLYIKQEDVEGTDSFGGAWEGVKRAVYPYYRK
jgi:hypothetical protein